MNAPSISVDLDLARDGTWATDVTARVSAVAGGRLSISRGQDRDGVMRVSELSLTLNNDDGAFTPEYTSGAYNGLLDDPAIPVRVMLTHTFEGTSYNYTLWQGYTLDYSVRVGPPGANVCEIRAADIWAWIDRGQLVDLAVSTSRTTGSALAAGFAALGIDSSLYDLDTGKQALPYHYEGKSPPTQFFSALVASELGGSGFVTGNGKVRFEDRESRLGLSQFDRAVRRYGAAAAWRFDEATGATVYDHSGNGNAMTLTNSPARGAALTGAYSLAGGYGTDFEAGSSQYGTVADHATLDVGDSFTYYYLFKLESLANQMVLSMKGSNNLTVSVKTNGEISLDKAGAASIGDSSGAGIAAGEWNLVVVTKSGATIKVYCNGADVSGAWVNATIENTANALSFGYYEPASVLYFDGVIARAGLFDAALTATQCQDLYLSYRLGLWGDGASVGVKPCEPPTYQRSAEELITKVNARGRVFREGQTITLWEDHAARNPFDPTQDATLALAPGEVYVDEILIGGAIVSVVTPVANLDYRGNTAADGTGTDRTSSLTITLTLLGGGGFRRKIQNTHATDTVYLMEHRVRAVPLQLLYEEASVSVEVTIAGQPAGREVTLDIPWAQGPGSTLRDFAFGLRETYDLPYPWITLSLAWDDDETVATCGWLEIGTLVTFADRDSGAWGSYVSDAWYVAAIEHEIDPGSWPYKTTVALYPSWLHRLCTQMVYDDFDRADTSATLGVSRSDDDWAGDSGYDIESGVAKPNAGTAALAYVDLGALAFDQALCVQLSGMSGSAVAGLAARRVDASNYWRCVFVRASNQVQLIKTVGGADTTVATASWTAAATGVAHWLIQGGRHRVWVNRKLAIDETAQTANNTGTGVGIYHSGAADDATFERVYAGRV